MKANRQHVEDGCKAAIVRQKIHPLVSGPKGKARFADSPINESMFMQIKDIYPNTVVAIPIHKRVPRLGRPIFGIGISECLQQLMLKWSIKFQWELLSDRENGYVRVANPIVRAASFPQTQEVAQCARRGGTATFAPIPPKKAINGKVNVRWLLSH